VGTVHKLHILCLHLFQSHFFPHVYTTLVKVVCFSMTTHRTDHFLYATGSPENCAWIATAHLNVRCPHCSRNFVNKSNLNIHIRDVHSNERGPFACLQCGRQVKNKSCLRVHMYQQHTRKGSTGKTDVDPCSATLRTELWLREKPI